VRLFLTVGLVIAATVSAAAQQQPCNPRDNIFSAMVGAGNPASPLNMTLSARFASIGIALPQIRTTLMRVRDCAT
jgi:hypothetical protein